MELYEVLDNSGLKKGYQKERTYTLLEEEYALVTHLWIKNKEGKFLTQQRSVYKKVDPCLWSITCGFVSYGESSKQAIARELKEELGIEVSLDEIKFVKRCFPKIEARHNHIADIFVLEKDVNLHDISMQVEEVMDVTYRSKEEIIDMMSNKEFMDFRIYYDNYYDSILGDMNEY